MPSQEDEIDQGAGREDATKGKVKERQTVLSLKHKDVLGNGAKLNQHSVPSNAWQDDVNATVGEAWQMSSFCHILFAGALVGTERLQDWRSSKSYRILRIAMRVCTPELQRNDTNLKAEEGWQWCQSKEPQAKTKPADV